VTAPKSLTGSLLEIAEDVALGLKLGKYEL
jgi:hypothetical protein